MLQAGQGSIPVSGRQLDPTLLLQLRPTRKIVPGVFPTFSKLRKPIAQALTAVYFASSLQVYEPTSLRALPTSHESAKCRRRRPEVLDNGTRYDAIATSRRTESEIGRSLGPFWLSCVARAGSESAATACSYFCRQEQTEREMYRSVETREWKERFGHICRLGGPGDLRIGVFVVGHTRDVGLRKHISQPVATGKCCVQ